MVTYIRGNDNLDSSNVATDTELASAGPSTNYGDVGTHVFGYHAKSYGSGTELSAGTTIAGSSIYNAGFQTTASAVYTTGGTGLRVSRGSSTLSGTWRALGSNLSTYSNTYHSFLLFVRIS